MPGLSHMPFSTLRLREEREQGNDGGQDDAGANGQIFGAALNHVFSPMLQCNQLVCTAYKSDSAPHKHAKRRSAMRKAHGILNFSLKSCVFR
jgi:hypothetical protein